MDIRILGSPSPMSIRILGSPMGIRILALYDRRCWFDLLWTALYDRRCWFGLIWTALYDRRCWFGFLWTALKSSLLVWFDLDAVVGLEHRIDTMHSVTPCVLDLFGYAGFLQIWSSVSRPTPLHCDNKCEPTSLHCDNKSAIPNCKELSFP
ncbi:hypothetical protein HAX54_015581 [Datura stramonium]|uniref:Uncharacterized protein n=1 Tax=Datura stramonium TaxID=4076 RepID=A0ABS8RG01_DATST|nr:hypothetical protein [Datura stramonium]